MTENLNIQKALIQHLDNFSDVKLLDNAKVDTITPDDADSGRWPVIKLSTGSMLRARLLVSTFPAAFRAAY